MAGTTWARALGGGAPRAAQLYHSLWTSSSIHERAADGQSTLLGLGLWPVGWRGSFVLAPIVFGGVPIDLDTQRCISGPVLLTQRKEFPKTQSLNC